MKLRKTKQPALQNFDDANAALYNIADWTLRIDRKTNEMNDAILITKKSYEPEINEMQNLILESEAQLEQFCRSNKKQFESKRSVELAYGRLGFRKGKLALKVISKKFNWEFAKEKFLSLFNSKYVDVKTKLNKTKIIADADKGILTAEQLAAAGCKLTRGETSFYEINWDEIKIIRNTD